MTYKPAIYDAEAIAQAMLDLHNPVKETGVATAQEVESWKKIHAGVINELKADKRLIPGFPVFPDSTLPKQGRLVRKHREGDELRTYVGSHRMMELDDKSVKAGVDAFQTGMMKSWPMESIVRAIYCVMYHVEIQG